MAVHVALQETMCAVLLWRMDDETLRASTTRDRGYLPDEMLYRKRVGVQTNPALAVKGYYYYSKMSTSPAT